MKSVNEGIYMSNLSKNSSFSIGGNDLAEYMMTQRIYNLAQILDTVWVVVVVIMIILAQAGFMMKETGSIKMKHNSVILLKTILVVAMSSMTFFIVGFGISMRAAGGLMG